jgi:hypothetical protein
MWIYLQRTVQPRVLIVAIHVLGFSSFIAVMNILQQNLCHSVLRRFHCARILVLYPITREIKQYN